MLTFVSNSSSSSCIYSETSSQNSFTSQPLATFAKNDVAVSMVFLGLYSIVQAPTILRFGASYRFGSNTVSYTKN